ncbi:uncharacterized protein C8R40DRAFT_1178388 [Lentinula edodes]|uniref:uncharacterized protein n=1 Tax=Lentinula edodes TaxID=5353 RepID=UPI001E8DF41A|nr:uncharacterized protein C8R40DRAFT_1178388 [Lentinula edodes]KAH7867967.1 hypothetical protein C8R40DRAFT_1178388 [Lentinula edodes]
MPEDWKDYGIQQVLMKGEAGRVRNQIRMAQKRAGMTEEEKAESKNTQKEAAAASYLRNRKTILWKAQDKWISEFVEKIRHPNADLWYPYHHNTYCVRTEAGIFTNPHIYL